MLKTPICSKHTAGHSCVVM